MASLKRRPATARDRDRTRTHRRRLNLQSLENRVLLAAGPYAPAAGQPGSTAIDRSSPSIVGWATGVAEYSPGIEANDPFDDPSQALGPASGEFGDVVSLGRGGTLTLVFDVPIRDGLGFDFAVFENSFSDTFLELGFVEVSSNGVDFVRFVSDSRTASPIGAFGELDPTNLNNLAGKYRGGFGVPFDLQELDGVAVSASNLNLQAITHVRLVDIIGDGSTTDGQGDPIYDPTPTSGSAGLDVDGVAVLNAVARGEVLVDFETLGATLPASGFNNGATAGGEFREAELRLNNDFDATFESWRGWAISNVSDTTTAGFTNQYAAYTGGGADGTDTYAVAFFDASATDPAVWPTITIDPASGSQFESLRITNTTYAALSMLNGDQFAGPFGGASGDDPDLLTVTVVGLDASGQSVGEVNVVLADYRFADNSQDFIVDDWLTVDVRDLVGARSLRFEMESTDVGSFGINTPTYFAVDEVVLSRAAVPLDINIATTPESIAATARVSRTTMDRATPVTVTLTSSGTDEIRVPPTVTIPAGAAFVELELQPADDDVATIDREFALTAVADGLLPTTRTLRIIDDEARRLSLDVASTTVDEGAGAAAVTFTLTRNDGDISGPLSVMVSVEGSDLIVPIDDASFAAGSRSRVLRFDVLDDDLAGPGQTAVITVSAAGYEDAVGEIRVSEDDLPQLSAVTSGVTLIENQSEPALSVTLSRNTIDVSEPLTVMVMGPPDVPLVWPAEATFAAGRSTVTFEITAGDDDLLNTATEFEFRALHAAFASARWTVNLIDDEQPPETLTVVATGGSLDESAGFVIGDFESFARSIADGQRNNDAGPSGAFEMGDVSLANSYTDFGTFESWSGFAVSRVSDAVTPGFGNQYAAFPGTGVDGSSTYAVAAAFSPVRIDRNAGAGGFQSIAIANTTYAALSMRDGDSFAKKFGGDDGSDADFFTLTITGLDADDQPTGTILFDLADFRFDDDSLDFIRDGWTTVDVSSLADSAALSFGLSSSDVGEFGMNTPAYFAIDDIRLADPVSSSSPSITITRPGESVDEPLVVSLTADPAFELPDRVTIEAGQTSVVVPVSIRNDTVFSGARDLAITLSADGFVTETASIPIVEDDVLALSVTPSAAEINESAGDALSIVVHRNDASPEAELIVTLAASDDSRLQLPSSVTLPAGVTSVRVPAMLIDDFNVQDDAAVTITARADSYVSGEAGVQLIDDDVAGLVVTLPTTTVAENETVDAAIRLTSQPTGPVVVRVIVGDDLSANLDAIMFTPENWNVDQTVVITATSDWATEPDEETMLTWRIDDANSDPVYRSVDDVIVALTVIDRSPENISIASEALFYVVRNPADASVLTQVPLSENFRITLDGGDQRIAIGPVSGATGLFTFDAGAGDDAVVLSTSAVTSLDGGDGDDTLTVTTELMTQSGAGVASGELDLAALLRHRIVGFETLVLAGPTDLAGGQPALAVRLDAAELTRWFGENPPEIVSRGLTDLQLSGGWRLSLSSSDDGLITHSLVSGELRVSVETTTPFRNPLLREDVNASGDVTALDALTIINRINENPDPTLVPPAAGQTWTAPYFDVSGDGRVTAVDALQVINRLNSLPDSRPSSASGEPTLTPPRVDAVWASPTGADSTASAWRDDRWRRDDVAAIAPAGGLETKTR